MIWRTSYRWSITAEKLQHQHPAGASVWGASPHCFSHWCACSSPRWKWLIDRTPYICGAFIFSSAYSSHPCRWSRRRWTCWHFCSLRHGRVSVGRTSRLKIPSTQVNRPLHSTSSACFCFSLRTSWLRITSPRERNSMRKHGAAGDINFLVKVYARPSLP